MAKRPSQLNQLTDGVGSDILLFEDVSVPDVGYITLNDFAPLTDRVRTVSIASNTTVAAGDRVLADTSGSTITATLPGSPLAGDEVWFRDDQRTWGTNNLTVDGNGNNILGASTFTADVDDWAFSLVFNGTQWVIGSRP